MKELTEDQVVLAQELAASLKAYGIAPENADRRTPRERVLDAMDSACKRLKRPVRVADLCEESGLSQSTVSDSLRHLREHGKVFALPDPQRLGASVYVPRVAP